MFEIPTADDGTFEVLEGGSHALRLHVTGAGFASRAMPIRARVGEVEVHHIVTWIGEDGFTGLLNERPADGDVLRLAWADSEELVDTTVTFHDAGIA
jgi:hypothetical protein